jgi:TRAP-type C4-dicarboxylate transport system substrate-binding protein
MKHRAIILSTLFATLASAAYAQNPAKTVWQYTLSDVVPNTVYMDYAEEIIPARIKQATGGRLEIIPHRSAVKSADVLDAVRDRRFDMGVQGANHRADMALFDFAAVPGLTRYEALGPVHDKLANIFQREMKAKFGVELLGFGYWPRQMILSSRKVETFKDLTGLKLRASSVSIQKVLAGTGATPVALPFSDVYVGIQRGTIDGAVSGAVAFSTAKWFENAKFSSEWPLGSANYFFIVNEDAWAELPQDLRDIVKKVVYDSAAETWKGALEEEGRGLEALKAGGVTHIIPIEAEAAKVSAVATPLIEDWRRRTAAAGDEVIKLVHEK